MKKTRLSHAGEPHTHTGMGGILKETVFGFNDGLVSTFAVIAGLYGGAVDSATILLAAVATLVAGTFSMGLGTFLGTKTERDHYEGSRKQELWEMEHMPDRERDEIREIYEAKGFEGKLLEDIVQKITSNDDLWLETMMREELGFAEKPPSPYRNGIAISLSFVIGSGIVTVPYLFDRDSHSLFYVSAAVAIGALLLVGAVKTHFTKKNIALSALETLLIGVLATAAAYGAGVVLGNVNVL